MATRVKDIIPSLITTKAEWHSSLLANWDSLVGKLHTRIRLEKIEGDLLVIGVYEVHWMQELHLLSQVLMDSLNTFLGASHVQQIRFKLVEERKKIMKRKITSAPRVAAIPLSPVQSQALTAIDDIQLKEALIHFWSRCVS